MGRRDFKTPEIVKAAIKAAESSSFGWLDLVLLKVLHSNNYSETLRSLDEYGWEYVFYLLQYEMMQDSIKEAWDMHQWDESKKQ